MDSIHQYGLIETEAEGISRFGDTTSNQAEQMNASIEEARIMPPITMIKHVAIKYSEKATSRLIGARRLLDGGHVIHPYIKEKAERTKMKSVGWMCRKSSITVVGNVATILFFVQKSVASSHHEVVKIICRVGSPSMQCTCLRDNHLGFPCKHG